MTFRGHIRNGVAVLDHPGQIPDGTRVRIEVDPVHAAFWQNKSVDQLAHEQGVRPMQQLSELVGSWPVEDSIDEFLTFIREVRK
jgi:hypothetical protein